MDINIGDIYAILTAFCWSSAVILFDLSGRLFTSLQISLIKNLIGVIGFIITILILKITILDFSLNEMFILIFSGILGVALGDFLFLKSLSIVGSGISAIIATIYVPSIFFIAYIFFGEIITKKVIIGGVLISCAIFIGTYKISKTLNQKIFLKGIIFGILAQIFTAISVLMVKPIMENHSVVSIALVRFGIGLIGILIVLIKIKGFVFLKETFNTGLKNLYVIMGSILGTYLSVIFWLAGFKYTMASRAAVYNELSTIMIIVMAYIFLKEPMPKRKCLAVFIAFIGALIVSIQ